MEMLWQILVAVLVILATSLVVLKLYLEAIKGKCTSTADLTGKVAVVTGANTGIGYYTALDIARRNARVILACRDMQKGKAAADRIKAATGNDNVAAMELDLSLMKSVRKFAECFLQQETRLDILINNAGVAGIPKTMTEEGFELMYASNHFGHFLLTNLLLDLLKRSQPSRVVTVSSMAHKWCKGLDLDNLKAQKSYSISEFYFSSKLANILFTRELARRVEGTGVTACSLHPGAVESEIWRHVPFVHRLFLAIPKILFFKTAEEGAQTSIYCAVSEEVKGHSGKYYVDCKEAEDQSSEDSKDMGMAKKLWEISEKYTGLV